MTMLEFTILIWLGSVVAGFLGSLTGLGGGVVIIPLLALAFGVDIRYAIWCITRFGDRNLFGGCSGLRKRRVLQYTDWDVS